MIATIGQILLMIGVPYLAQVFTKKTKIEQWLSPVVFCYAIGIAVAKLRLMPLQNTLSNQFTEVTILLAIPLLLFSTDIPSWLKYAKSTIVSFLLCVLSSILITVTMAWLFSSEVGDIWQYSGMMLGLFTGGAPNMQAVGLMLEASEDKIVLVNAADIFCGGIYLIFLTSVAHRFFGLFLPDFDESKIVAAQQTSSTSLPKFQQYLIAIGLVLAVMGASLGITYLLTGALKSIVLILLLLTTFSIALSFIPLVRSLSKTFEMGEYLLLVFCVAIGLLADFSSILKNGGMVILLMSSIWLGIAALHALLCYFFRIDRDTLMITSTAAIYGPVFVGQVASAIGNKRLVFSGMATGLIGYAVGNYLGVAIAYLLKYWL